MHESGVALDGREDEPLELSALEGERVLDRSHDVPLWGEQPPRLGHRQALLEGREARDLGVVGPAGGGTYTVLETWSPLVVDRNRRSIVLSMPALFPLPRALVGIVNAQNCHLLPTAAAQDVTSM